MSTSVEFCIALIRDAFQRAERNLPGETIGLRCCYAWGHVTGQLIRHGAKYDQVKDLIFEESGNAHGEGMSIEQLTKAIGLSINEVLLTTPSSMLNTDPEEALEDMACRLVLEGVKQGLCIIDRRRYDRLINENAAMRDALASRPRA